MRDIVSPLSGIRSPFGERRGISPSVLFALAEPGVWLDPSDTANLSWRRNLLTFTEQFDNAVWSKVGSTVSANSAIAPDGTTTADKLIPTATVAQHRVDFTTTIAADTYTFSVYVKADGYNFAWLRIGTNPSAVFSLVDGTITGLAGTATATNVGSGWWRLTISGSSLANSICRVNAANDSAGSDFLGNGTSGILIWGAQLELGSTATDYQRITDVNTETAALFPNATLYQDTAGTTPVTTPGQSVALALDKSRGLVLGPELVTNGDFSGGSTGWTVNAGWSITGGAAVGAATSASLFGGGFTPVAGRTYRVDFDAVSYTSGTLFVTVGGNYSGNPTLSLAAMAPGRKTVYVIAGSTPSRGVEFYGGSIAATIDNISVRELPGNHATQATSGSRPLYALLPANGVRNLANGSASVADTTYWPAAPVNNGITATKIGSGFDVDGLPYVDVRYQGTATGTFHSDTYTGLTGFLFASTGQQWTCSATFSRIGGSIANVSGIRTVVAEYTAPSTYVTQGNSAFATATTETTASVSHTVATGNRVQGLVQLVFTNAAVIDVTFRIKAIQLELGSTRTAYQFNYASTNIAQPPFAQVGALLFDGVDDFLQTPSVDFAGYQILGSELVTNGDFATDTWWSKDATATIAGGVGVFTNTPASSGFFRSALLQTGVFYSVTYTISSITSGAVRVLLGTGSSVVQSSAGTYTEIIQCSGSGQLYVQAFSGSATNATVDNISVREVLRPADKMTVFAGVRKIRDTAQAAVVSVGNLPDTVNGSLSLRAPALALNNYALRSRGTATAPATSGAFPAPDTAVLSGLADISGDAATLRRNGTQISFSNADQGTGNFGNHSIYIGQDGTGTALPFNGYLYSLIVRGAATPADLITLTERWVNSRTGAY
jgi:hypothetical protein